ncbi:MAG: DUF503 domain-containing protein [Candidatus Hydrogenedentes bacterium]|nr:DUF503 domain-containing protein [Candidatus Hydrogenedentota bacterium]
MTIGLLQMELLLPEARSLKDKRRLIKSLKDRLHNKFNCSVAETGGQDLWQRSSLAVCIVGGDSRHVNSQLNTVVTYVEMSAAVVLVDYRMELL